MLFWCKINWKPINWRALAICGKRDCVEIEDDDNGDVNIIAKPCEDVKKGYNKDANIENSTNFESSYP